MNHELIQDIVYSEPMGYRPLSLDLHLPSVAGAPLIVFIHGGGWRLGSRRVFVPTIPAGDAFDQIVSAGFAVASIDYRLSGEAKYPAQLDDVTTALGDLRNRVTHHGVDPSRIVLWGESAGATIAALVGLQQDAAIRGVIDWYGPSDLTALASGFGQLDDADTREAGWLGGPLSSLPMIAKEASPINRIHGQAPPFFIAHGLSDTAVPAIQSESFASALAAAGVQSELRLIPEAGHMWSGNVDHTALLDEAIAFARHVTA